MGEENEVSAAIERHLAKGSVARLPRPGLDALAACRSLLEHLRHELHRQAASRPAAANIIAFSQPAVSVCTEAVVDVQRENAYAEGLRHGQRGMKQRRRIAAAAEGDGDDALRHDAAFSAQSCR
jgi:hypothetical protein